MQSSIVIQDSDGATLLTNISNALASIAGDFTGSSAPSPTYAGMTWIDTSQTNIKKWQRDNADAKWVLLGTFIYTSGTQTYNFQPANVIMSDGSVSMTGALNLGGNKATNMTAGTDDTDGVNMAQLNAVAAVSDDIKSVNKAFIVFNDKKKIQFKAGTAIKLTTDTDTLYFKVTTDTIYDVTTILDTGSTLQSGKDYSIYLVPNGSGGVIPKVSLNSTYPTGYTAANSRRVGGFHTECVAVGTISGHPLSGWSAGDILPASVWTLLHRPNANPNGMVYVAASDLWVDIYLQSGTGVNATSAYGATVADTRAWNDFAEDLFLVNKRMPSDIEFSCLAEGSNQKTAIFGSASPTPKTSGGHIDTAARRMVSNYGVEECCGFINQWLDNPSANGGSGWTNADGLAGAKGQLYGASYALVAGGDWTYAASCGSRCRNAYYVRAFADASLGGRGVSLPKRN